MKNKGFIYTLVIIIIAGITITLSTSRAIDKSRQQNTTAAATTFAKPEAPGNVSESQDEGVPETAGSRVASIQEEGPALDGAAEEAAGPGAGATETMASETDMKGGPGASVPEPETAAGPGMNRSAETAETEKKTYPLSPLEPATPIADTQGKTAAKPEAAAAIGAAENSYHLNRLRELDVQIQRNREKQSASNNYSAKSMAESELKLWDNERNSIYGEIMERLDVAQASSLVDEEREWMKERDRLAAEAAKASAGGSMESVEYTLSLVESTRLRSYELIENYGYLLRE